MATEVWQNTYDGFDTPSGSTRWVLDSFRDILPAASIDPKCAKDGHRWSRAIHPLSSATEVVGCIRCARRGLVVLESRSQVG